MKKPKYSCDKTQKPQFVTKLKLTQILTNLKNQFSESKEKNQRKTAPVLTSDIGRKTVLVLVDII